MSRESSLSYLTLPGIDPLEQITIAGEAGYDYVSLRTIPWACPESPNDMDMPSNEELFGQFCKDDLDEE